MKQDLILNVKLSKSFPGVDLHSHETAYLLHLLLQVYIACNQWNAAGLYPIVPVCCWCVGHEGCHTFS